MVGTPLRQCYGCGVRTASLARSLSHRLALSLVLLVALSLRLAWGLGQPGTLDRRTLPDQVEYLELAQNLLRHHTLRFFDDRPAVNEMVYAYRTPGYPMFLAALGANVRIARAAQAMIDSLTVLAVYLLARRWLDRRTSLIAAAIVAVNPFLIYFSGLILSETLFTAMLAWGMVLLAGILKTPSPALPRNTGGGGKCRSATHQPSMSGRGGFSRRFDSLRRLKPPLPAAESRTNKAHASWPRGEGYIRFLAGGFLLALSVLVRPSALFLPILLGVGAVCVNRRGRKAYPMEAASMPRWRAALAGAAMLALTALVLFPWAYRNHHVLGKWIWTTTNGGVTLYDGFNPSATGASDQSFLTGMPWLGSPNYGEIKRSEYLSNRAWKWIAEHPGRAAWLGIVKIGRTWSPIPLSDAYGGQLRYVLVGLFYSVPLDLLILYGLWVATARGGIVRSAKVFLLLPAIYFTVVHALSVGSLRYRIPVEPPMAILAGMALAALFYGFKRDHRPPSATDTTRHHAPSSDSSRPPL